MTVTEPISRRTTPTDTETVGLRVFTRTAINAQWLSSALSPAVHALAGTHRIADLRLRHGWLNGPHVDLLADGGTATVPWGEVLPLIDAGATVAGALTEETYLDQAREFGRLERVAPPYLPLEEHGTVRRLTAAARPAGDGRLDVLREQVECRLSRQVVRTADRLVADGGSSTRAIAEAMVAAAGAHRAGLAFGCFSYRSHAEAFLSWSAQRRDVRPVFERRRQDDLPWLRELIADHLATRSGAGGQQWTGSCEYALGVLDGAVATGELTLADLDRVSPAFDPATMGPPGGDGVATGSQSDFHARLEASGAIDEPPAWFASYRTLLNVLYEQFLLLGLPPLHRYYLCFAIAETVDELDGHTWQERLA